MILSGRESRSLCRHRVLTPVIFNQMTQPPGCKLKYDIWFDKCKNQLYMCLKSERGSVKAGQKGWRESWHKLMRIRPPPLVSTLLIKQIRFAWFSSRLEGLDWGGIHLSAVVISRMTMRSLELGDLWHSRKNSRLIEYRITTTHKESFINSLFSITDTYYQIIYVTLRTFSFNVLSVLAKKYTELSYVFVNFVST